MKYLKRFEKFEQPQGTGEESFWEVEISGKVVRITMYDVMKQVGNEIIEVSPESIKHLLIDVERDPNRVEAADLNYPIILVKSKGKFISILDGQHRVVKSLQKGIDNIGAKVLDLDRAPQEFIKAFNR